MSLCDATTNLSVIKNSLSELAVIGTSLHNTAYCKIVHVGIVQFDVTSSKTLLRIKTCEESAQFHCQNISQYVLLQRPM